MDRDSFLGRIAARQAPPPSAGPHPPPAPHAFQVAHVALEGVDGADPDALAPVFLESAARVGAVARVVTAEELPDAVRAVVEELGARSAVVSAEPEAQGLRQLLFSAGVDVADHTVPAAAVADLGVTSAVAGVAATGSVVVSSAAAGGRGAAVLPQVHLCVLPIDRLRATTLDVLREHGGQLPSNLTFVTGPSRTGDIELILTVGVHGPVAVHILLVS